MRRGKTQTKMRSETETVETRWEWTQPPEPDYVRRELVPLPPGPLERLFDAIVRLIDRVNT